MLFDDRRLRLSCACGRGRHRGLRAIAQQAPHTPSGCRASSLEFCTSHRAEVSGAAYSLNVSRTQGARRITNSIGKNRTLDEKIGQVAPLRDAVLIKNHSEAKRQTYVSASTPLSPIPKLAGLA